MFLYFYWRDHELVRTKYTMPWLQMPRGNHTSGLLDPYRTSWCLMQPLKTVQTWKRRTNQETTAAGKHKTLTQCMINVGPASQTVNQRWSCIGSTFSRLPSSANRRNLLSLHLWLRSSIEQTLDGLFHDCTWSVIHADLYQDVLLICASHPYRWGFSVWTSCLCLLITVIVVF